MQEIQATRAWFWVRKIPWRRKWQPTPVFLARKIPWTEEPGRLQSIGLQSWTWLSDWAHTRTHTHTKKRKTLIFRIPGFSRKKKSVNNNYCSRENDGFVKRWMNQVLWQQKWGPASHSAWLIEGDSSEEAAFELCLEHATGFRQVEAGKHFSRKVNSLTWSVKVVHYIACSSGGGSWGCLVIKTRVGM